MCTQGRAFSSPCKKLQGTSRSTAQSTRGPTSLPKLGMALSKAYELRSLTVEWQWEDGPPANYRWEGCTKSQTDKLQKDETRGMLYVASPSGGYQPYRLVVSDMPNELFLYQSVVGIARVLVRPVGPSLALCARADWIDSEGVIAFLR